MFFGQSSALEDLLDLARMKLILKSFTWAKTIYKNGQFH
jgi:hypothetical protein